MRLLSRKFTANFSHTVVALHYRCYTTVLSYLLIPAFSFPPVQLDSFKKENYCSTQKADLALNLPFVLKINGQV